MIEQNPRKINIVCICCAEEDTANFIACHCPSDECVLKNENPKKKGFRTQVCKMPLATTFIWLKEDSNGLLLHMHVLAYLLHLSTSGKTDKGFNRLAVGCSGSVWSARFG